MITIIFDIDGTLVDSAEFDSELYINAVKETIPDVFIHDDCEKYTNVTDSGILNQIINENNISDAKVISLRVRERFGELIMDHLESNQCEPIRGAIDTINELLNQ